MSNIFNYFYVNVADGITKTIPLTPKSPLEYLSNRTGNSLFLTPVTLLEVNDIINILNPSKSVGYGCPFVAIFKPFTFTFKLTDLYLNCVNLQLNQHI